MFSWLYDLENHPTGLRFFVLRVLTVHVLPFSNIESVMEREPRGRAPWGAVNFRNRLLRRTFLIVTCAGWFARKILVTPKDPERFLSHLRDHGVTVSTR